MTTPSKEDIKKSNDIKDKVVSFPNGKCLIKHEIMVDLIAQSIAEAREEEREKIIKKIKLNRSCKSHEPENCQVCDGRQEAIEAIRGTK